MISAFLAPLRRLPCLAASAAALWSGHGIAADIKSSLTDDGRAIWLEVPGRLSMQADFRAVVERENHRRELVSTASSGKIERKSATETTPIGNVAVQQVGVSFEDDGCILLLRYGQLPGVPGILVQSGIQNISKDTLRFVSSSPLSMAGSRQDETDRRVFLETRMAGSIWHPFGKPCDNSSVHMTPIRLFGEEFAHGIGCQAPCDMRFPLGGKFSRFRCVAGVDGEVTGSVTFEVHADGKKLFDSGKVISGQPSRVIDLDVTGAKELRLVVTDAKDGNNFDWADWANAVLTPAAGSDNTVPSEDAPGIRFTGSPADWLACPMISQSGGGSGRSLDHVFDPLTIREAGGLYDTAGLGMFFGPVGTPVTYLTGTIRNRGKQQATLDLEGDMNSVAVRPGQVRWGQEAVLLLERPQVARERWVSWVAETHHARPPRAPVSGWLSWYWLGTYISEANLMQVADFPAKSGKIFHPDVIQIDDGYQLPDGKPGMNGKFPSGARGVASKIAATGAMPGLMVRLESAEPAGFDHYLQNIRHAVSCGFRYLKIADPEIPSEPVDSRTCFERRRDFYFATRKAAGENAYLLAATNGTDRASIGAVDACRVSGSTERHKINAEVEDTIRSLAVNHRWFAVDTDCYYLATDIENLPPVAGGWAALRTKLSVTGLACGNAMTSDPWHWDSMAPFLRHTEILTPPARESARAIDLGVSPQLERIVGQVTRPWGAWTVALLWNQGTQAKSITLDFAKAGMNPDMHYAVWSFWDNRFLGFAENSWTTEVLGPSASQHLCFTPITRNSEVPTLIGSNLHAWCGAAEFERVTALHGAMEIVLGDAGARAGDLFVHCASPPVLRAASGCTIKGITSAGEDIWKISLEGRTRGAVQQIDLGVHLPITRQPWFWTLLVLSFVSIGLGVWRYLEKLRFEQEVIRLKQIAIRNEERSRIARDLHDELGANLARIGLLTELAGQAVGDPKKTHDQLDRILGAARSLSRQLDSVVWAVDPANDTLESLARYLHGHAEDYLQMAGIRCRFECMDLPDLPLASSLRHHLLMITKESLHNVVKHANASIVSLRLNSEAGVLSLEIEDDGTGPGLTEGHRHGNGLNNMRKRAKETGGTFEFKSARNGTGTLVHLRIPLKPEPLT